MSANGMRVKVSERYAAETLSKVLFVSYNWIYICLLVENAEIAKIVGIFFLEKALEIGTSDMLLVTAVYSQLGNAYYARKDYAKAYEYHSRDLLLSRFVLDWFHFILVLNLRHNRT